jgi:hypothetical protein
LTKEFQRRETFEKQADDLHDCFTNKTMMLARCMDELIFAPKELSKMFMID